MSWRRILFSAAVLLAIGLSTAALGQVQRLTDGKVYGPGGLISDPDLAAVTRRVLEVLAAQPLSSTGSGRLDLNPDEMASYDGQVKWVQRSTDPGLKSYAETYWHLHPGDPMPPLVAVQLHPRFYATPEIESFYSGNKLARAAAMALERTLRPDTYEVDSQQAKGEFTTAWQRRGTSGNLMQVFAKEEAHINQCGAAVKALRAKRVFRGREGNAIDQFDELCLFANDKTEPPKLDTEQEQQARQCQTLYLTYDAACFYRRYDAAVNTRLLNALAIVFVASGPGTYHANIACTGLFLDQSLVLTARHCAEDFIRRAPNDLKNPPFLMVQAELGRYGSPAPAYLQGIPLGRRVEEIRDLDQNDTARPTPGGVPANTDYVLLRLAHSNNDDLPAFGDGKEKTAAWSFQQPRLDQALVMPGFSDLVVRAELLKSRINNDRLATDFDRLATQSWKSAIRIDQSPVCAILVIENRELRHYCQSFKGASGAPLVSLDGSVVPGNRQGLAVIGVHGVGIRGGPRNEPGNVGAELTEQARFLAERMPRPN